MMIWYYRLLALYPKWIIAITLITSLTAMFVSFTLEELPDFSDPSLGFEARGTEIGKRHTSWTNLLEETRSSGRLTANPYDKLQQPKMPSYPKKKKSFRHGKLKKNHTKHDDMPVSSAQTLANEHELPKNKTKKTKQKKVHIDHNSTDSFFCGYPNREYSHLVIERSDSPNKDLFDIEALHALCNFTDQMTSTPSYAMVCDTETYSKKCCRPWSISSYILLLTNKTNCAEIQPDDTENVKSLLRDCFPYYRNRSLSAQCDRMKCAAPDKCTHFNAAYHIFHYIIDNKLNGVNTTLETTMLFLPVAKSTRILPYYYEIAGFSSWNGVLEVVAMDMGLKNTLFDDLLIYDGWLIALGALFVLYCILIYTNSIALTISTVLANIFAIVDAYFIYQFIYRLPYFPFMNLLAVIIIVGIGADDCFVYVKEWRLAMDEWSSKPAELPGSESQKVVFLMTTTMKHAAESIFITSITTAMAFFASYFSTITAIQCFGIYTGTVIMVNYFLMMTWLPAVVAVVEQSNMTVCTCWQRYSAYVVSAAERCGLIMNECIIRIVSTCSYLLITVFVLLGLASGYVVLYYPQLGLPDSQTFQLLCRNHPFEAYDIKYAYKFAFEKSYVESETYKMPIRFVWGVEAADDGNPLIPVSKGHLHLDGNFSLSSPDAQQWLLDFCRNVKKQSFYHAMEVPVMLQSCFIENFIENMKKIKCFEPMTNASRAPCCESESFPFKAHVFDKCLPEMVYSLYKSPRYIFVPGNAGPKFEQLPFEYGDDVNRSALDLPKARALVIEYESTQLFTTSYLDIKNFSQSIEHWFANITKAAPSGLQNGWFTSQLEFHDLQDNLLSGTAIAAAISMVSSLIVLLVFTRNVMISFYAVLSVTFTIFTTIGILVMLDWRLNILESIAVSTAIGLGIDFVLHYAMNYRMSGAKQRTKSAELALSRMIGPTITAALTTFIAGFFMIFSSVLAYIQIGIFLVIVMTVSWIYATFFFGSLLYAFGPEIESSESSETDDQHANAHLMGNQDAIELQDQKS